MMNGQRGLSVRSRGRVATLSCVVAAAAIGTASAVIAVVVSTASSAARPSPSHAAAADAPALRHEPLPFQCDAVDPLRVLPEAKPDRRLVLGGGPTAGDVVIARWDVVESSEPCGPTGTGAIELCQHVSGSRPPLVARSDLPPWASAGHGPQHPYGQGSYVEPGRTAHVPEYRLRVDDELELVYRITRDETTQPYKLNVGDEIRFESLTDRTLNRDLVIQPDGTITLLLLGQVKATGRTVAELRDELERRYSQFYKRPEVTVTPLRVNTKLHDIINTVDRRLGFGGQVRTARVTPDGTISLPAVGVVPAQGLTLEELKRELDARYALEVEGMEVTPILVQRAPRFVYVLGEVAAPGRYTMEGPTNVMQAIALAGRFTVAANLRQVVIFRRGPDWRIHATVIDVWDALYGDRTCPIDDLWLADSDVVVIPKTKIQVCDEFIEQIFTRGVYGVLPFQGVSVNLSKLSTL
jgi:polysaccharide export outer membrane protein